MLDLLLDVEERRSGVSGTMVEARVVPGQRSRSPRVTATVGTVSTYDRDQRYRPRSQLGTGTIPNLVMRDSLLVVRSRLE